MPTLHSPVADGTSELISNLLTSVLPNIRDSKTVAVTTDDALWEEVLWDREEESRPMEAMPKENPDDIYVSHDKDSIPMKRRGDWVGVERDRRSAFLIMGALKSEGIL